ncbi:hypothetical protein P22_3199 [Propionispora sp. 2/2-37]|nr:hypothetical protein P22_3199 [Propionispora sp. 2/2-37]
MPFRVAVASDDGRLINRHFAKTEQFWIFKLVDGRFYLDEVRDVQPVAYDNHQEKLLRIVEGIEDCGMAVASEIGPGAAVIMGQKGMEPFVTGDTVEEALARIAWRQQKNYIAMHAEKRARQNCIRIFK